MTQTTHRDAALRELAAATEYRTQLADLYNEIPRPHDLIGALRQGVKFSLEAAQAHATMAVLEAIEHNWQPVTINVASSLDQHGAEAIVEQLERARRSGMRVRTW